MRTPTFVDTSGFYALLVSADDQHERAVAILRAARAARHCFVTTDYILDETATLLKTRGPVHLIRPFFETVTASRVCQVIWTDRELFDQAQAYFVSHLDHEYSFTDCLSFCAMAAQQTRDALTKDTHFAAAGFRVLLG
jgi:predicted nucleic acid-binding protein